MTIMSQCRIETSVTLFRRHKSCVRVVTLTWGGHSSHNVPFPAIFLWRTEDAKMKKYKRYCKKKIKHSLIYEMSNKLIFPFDLHLYLFTFVSFQLFTFPYNFL